MSIWYQYENVGIYGQKLNSQSRRKMLKNKMLNF